MRLRSVFASLPLVTQRLLVVLCTHFVRISATHPRKLRIPTKSSSTLSGKCGGSIEQCSPKSRPDQKNIKMKNTHNFLRNYCANQSPGDRQVLQNNWTEIGGTWMRVGRQRRKVDTGWTLHGPRDSIRIFSCKDQICNTNV